MGESMTARPGRCARCGGSLDPAIPGSTCPKCLLADGLQERAGVPNEEALQLLDVYREALQTGETFDVHWLAREFPGAESFLHNLDEIYRLGLAAAGSRSFHDSIRQSFGAVEQVTFTLSPLENTDGNGQGPGSQLQKKDLESARRYVSEGEVARGGMGIIYSVRDRDLNRRIAMKVMGKSKASASGPTTSASESALLARFLEEAQVTAQLDHPGIVPVHEVGLDAQGRLYFTMKLVRGHELGEVIKAMHAGSTDWTLGRVVGVLVKVCQTLAFAHDRGVLHRDLKPANIMLGDYGEVYVMDWGLAKIRGRTDLHDVRVKEDEEATSGLGEGELSPSPVVTLDGSVVGTPAYMSPEQARGETESLDEPSDIYSVGAILYHVLAGHAPYGKDRATPREILARVKEGPPEKLGAGGAQPPALVAICEKAMARPRQDRYRSGLELASDLQAWLDGRVVQAYRTGATAELQAWVRRNRATAIAAMSALLLLLVAAGSAIAYLGWANRSYRDRVYLAEIYRAGQAWQAGQYDTLKTLLQRCPEEYRGWEWLFLAGQTERWHGKDHLRLAHPILDMSLFDSGRRYALLVVRQGFEIRDGTTHQLITSLDHTNTTFSSIMATVDSQPLLAYQIDGTNDPVRIVDGRTGNLIQSIDLDHALTGMALSWDGKVLAVSDHAGGVHLWDIETGQRQRILRPGPFHLSTLVFHPKGEWVACGTVDGWIHLVGLDSGHVLRSIRVGEESVRNSWIHPEGNLLAAAGAGSGGANPFSRLIDLEEGWMRSLEAGGGVSSMAFVPGSTRLLIGESRGGISIYDVQNSLEVERIAAYRMSCVGVGMNAAGDLLSGGFDGVVSSWIPDKSTSDLLQGESYSLRVVDFSGDNRFLVVGGIRSPVPVWDRQTSSYRSYQEHEANQVVAVAFAHHTNLIASCGSDGGIHLWDAESLEARWKRRLPEGVGWPWWVQFSPDDRWLAAAGPSGAVALLDADTGQLLREPLVLPSLERSTDGMTISPDGRYLALCEQNRRLVVWSTRTWEIAWSVPARPSRSVVFSDDGEWILTGDTDGRVTTYAVEEGGRVLQSLGGHEGAVSGVAISRDKTRIFSAGDDGTARIWDVRQGVELLRIPLQSVVAWHLDLSPDNQTLAVADDKGAIHLYHAAENRREPPRF